LRCQNNRVLGITNFFTTTKSVIGEASVSVKKKITDVEILEMIKSMYPQNCKECNQKILKITNQYYYCNLKCNTNIEIVIDKKISDEELLSIIRSQYPENCKDCNNKLFNKIKLHNSCIFNCIVDLDDDDIEYLSQFSRIQKDTFYRIHSYIEEKYNDNCSGCSKILKNKMKKKLYSLIANDLFEDLSYLNSILVHYGFQKENTHKKAVDKIKKNIYINIYDLIDKRYDKRFNNLAELSKYTKTNKKYFPIDDAKSQNLQAFLQVLR